MWLLFSSLYSKYRQIGFAQGYSLGEEAGWREGYVFGVKRGAQIAAEIGFYQGFVHAWIEILEKEDEAKQRKLVALRTLLEMTRQFPKTNLENQDTTQRLARIRAKFKQVNSLLKSDLNYSFNSSFNLSMDAGDELPTPCASTRRAHSRKSPLPTQSSSNFNEMSFWFDLISNQVASKKMVLFSNFVTNWSRDHPSHEQIVYKNWI